jgi:hypothetical protein
MDVNGCAEANRTRTLANDVTALAERRLSAPSAEKSALLRKAG